MITPHNTVAALLTLAATLAMAPAAQADSPFDDPCGCITVSNDNGNAAVNVQIVPQSRNRAVSVQVGGETDLNQQVMNGDNIHQLNVQVNGKTQTNSQTAVGADVFQKNIQIMKK